MHYQSVLVSTKCLTPTRIGTHTLSIHQHTGTNPNLNWTIVGHCVITNARKIDPSTSTHTHRHTAEEKKQTKWAKVDSHLSSSNPPPTVLVLSRVLPLLEGPEKVYWAKDIDLQHANNASTSITSRWTTRSVPCPVPKLNELASLVFSACD